MVSPVVLVDSRHQAGAGETVRWAPTGAVEVVEASGVLGGPPSASAARCSGESMLDDWTRSWAVRMSAVSDREETRKLRLFGQFEN